MEFVIIAVVVVAAIALFYLTRDIKSADVNKDGNIDLADAALAAKHVVQEAKNIADVNKDGQINVDDVKAAAETVKKSAKQSAANVGAKTRAAVKKATTKKPTAKKS